MGPKRPPLGAKTDKYGSTFKTIDDFLEKSSMPPGEASQ